MGKQVSDALRQIANAIDEQGWECQSMSFHIYNGEVGNIYVGHALEPCTPRDREVLADYARGHKVKQMGNDARATLVSHAGDFPFTVYNVFGVPNDSSNEMSADEMVRRARGA